MLLEWYDLVGYLGATILVIAFGAQQSGKISSENIIQPLLNGVAALLILISLIYRFNPAAFLVQVLWIFFSIIAVIRLLRETK